jgi:uncharacterized protein (TIGR02466 family)|tara:strand:- start:669 stop:1319 length:651 start_codon:yes stop_codon:yes gene_type:complete
MKIDYAFPIPIVTLSVDALVVQDTLDRVKKYIEADMPGSKNETNKLLTTYYHNNKNFLGKINAIPLLTELNQHIRGFLELRGMNPECYVEITSWLQLNQPGSLFNRHDHYGAIVSGVFYLEVPKNGGKLKFHNPLEARRATDVFFDRIRKEENQYNYDYIEYDPKAGELIMFESWLQHSVEINNSNQDRLSVSFNVWADVDDKAKKLRDERGDYGS